MMWVLKLLGFLGKLLPLLFAWKAGKDGAEKQAAEQNVEAAKRIAKANGESPTSKFDVLDRLHDPKRQL